MTKIACMDQWTSRTLTISSRSALSIIQSSLTPAISSPILSMSASSASNKPRISPWKMTAMQSDKVKISSRSSENSRMPTPLLRSSRNCWCTYSITPTSKPRVGWFASRTEGLEPISRAKHHLLQVSTRQVASHVINRRRCDLVRFHALFCKGIDRFIVQLGTLAEWLAPLAAQDQILSDGEIHHQAFFDAVAGYMGHILCERI